MRRPPEGGRPGDFGCLAYYFLAQCLPPDGADLLKSAPSLKRLGMREIESPYLLTGSFPTLYASPDAVVRAIKPPDVGGLPADCLLLHVVVSGAPCVSAPVRILTHTREPPGCLQSACATDDLGRMLSWVPNTDRAVLIEFLRGPLIEEFHSITIRDSAQHFNAWASCRPSESGFTYDGIANICANPGDQQTPDRVFLNASLPPSLKGAHICGAKKCAKLRATLR